MAINPLLVSTISVDELPPSAFSLTDKIPHSIAGNLFSGTIQDLIDLVRVNSTAFQNEIKYLSVDNQYIIDNFDVTGLGTNLCLGWAIMNGNNGTTNIDGKVLVAYGNTYNVLGQFGGSTDAVVVAHSHAGIPTFAPLISGGAGGGNLVVDNTGSTNVAGVSGVNKNMQPYIVVLAIKKL
jgi:hypothetical protein